MSQNGGQSVAGAGGNQHGRAETKPNKRQRWARVVSCAKWEGGGGEGLSFYFVAAVDVFCWEEED